MPIEDHGEQVSLMEPLCLSAESPHRAQLTDLAFELARKSEGFRRSLPRKMVGPLAGLVRSMNCYYSNLIEGHNTHPIDIERALKEDYSAVPEKRNLQLEAKAHISVQQWIDEGGIAGSPATVQTIREIHRRFYENMPAELRWIKNPTTDELIEIIPGELRHNYVKVGEHVSISPGAVPRFLLRYENVYSGLGMTDSLLAAGAAHHRLAWIHPFLDGNGRVIRLLSHATLLKVLDTGALWSVARGLARRVDEYKRLLAECDRTRRGDLDGRGNLSEGALVGFTSFFLNVCLDQVTFMEGLMQPDLLQSRILRWASEEIDLGKLPAKARDVLEALLYRDELTRGQVAEILNVTDRQARRITSALFESGAVTSRGLRDPITLAFPAILASRWMPGLFPDKVD